jgi:predicted lipoprotein with Yx(FWY)xxD motif
MVRLLAPALLVSFASFGLVGCGCEDESPPPPPVSTLEAAPPAPAPPALAPSPPAVAAPGLIAAGTTGMANWQQRGHFYPVVVTGSAPDGRVSVVYADGDMEWVQPGVIRPDVIGVGTRLEARVRTWPRFFPGRVTQRIGHAVFVEFDDGDRQWTSIGLVRVGAADFPAAAPVEAAAPTARLGDAGSLVLANYQGAGQWYPAVVAARRQEDGAVHVIYADGDNEWVAPARIRADSIGAGTAVQVAPKPPERPSPLAGTVERRVGHAVEVRYEDRTTGWVALSNVRVQ